MKLITKQAIHTTTFLALLLSLVLALSAPCGYLIMALEYKHAVLDTETQAAADFLTQLIGANPGYWRYEQPRLEDFLAHRPFDNHNEIRMITDEKGTILAQNKDTVAPPLITRSHALYDSGRVVGRIVISRSLRRVLLNTLGFALFGISFGIGAFVLLRVFLLRALDQALESLEESESTFRAMASTAADAIIVVDNDGRITFWNDAANRMFGYPAGEALGRELQTLIMPPEDVLPGGRGFPQARRAGEDPGAGNTLEFTALRKDGERFPIEMSTSAVELEGTWHAVGILRDLTARKKIETELVKIEKVESLGVLAGGIAHDFNNLLTAVLGNISLARLDSGNAEQREKWLSEGERAVLRARDLTRQLLTFSKGGAPVRKASSIRQIVEESCGFSLSGSNVKSRLSFAEGLWPADIDPGQISQVMHNIIINAVQAMPWGGVVTISCENAGVADGEIPPLAAGRYLKITIRDQGPGIPPDVLPNIFDPYFTTKPTGSGLGLAMSYSIVKRHGGHIGVESAPGYGTTFRIYLPASQQEATEPGVVREKSATGSGRVLVMDDEELVLQVAGEMLKALGYEPVFARHGVEAIELYRQAQQNGAGFTAVIMDLTIPGGMGGKEAVKELLALAPRARVIAASGYSDDPVMANYRDGYGFLSALTKPFTLQTLGEALKSVLR